MINKHLNWEEMKRNKAIHLNCEIFARTNSSSSSTCVNKQPVRLNLHSEEGREKALENETMRTVMEIKYKISCLHTHNWKHRRLSWPIGKLPHRMFHCLSNRRWFAKRNTLTMIIYSCICTSTYNYNVYTCAQWKINIYKLIAYELMMLFTCVQSTNPRSRAYIRDWK